MLTLNSIGAYYCWYHQEQNRWILAFMDKRNNAYENIICKYGEFCQCSLCNVMLIKSVNKAMFILDNGTIQV